jgi:hypothetical protein
VDLSFLLLLDGRRFEYPAEAECEGGKWPSSSLAAAPLFLCMCIFLDEKADKYINSYSFLTLQPTKR